MLHRFLKCRSGNFTLIAAVCMVPLIGAAALITDYANLTRKQVHLQNATDAAAFFLVSEYDRTRRLPTNEEAKKAVSSAYANVKSAEVEVTDEELIVRAQADERLFFGGFLPTDMGSVSTLSAVSLPSNRIIHVAMVLDSTFSMSAGNKIGAMKEAANGFIDTLLGLQNDRTSVKIGIVPFSNYVNVGLANRHASWMDVPPDTEESSYQCRKTSDVISKTNCRSVTRYNDGVPYQAEQCDYEYGPEREECRTVTHRRTWRGCVGSRDAPLNLRDSRPGIPFPGLLNVSCSGELSPLTSQASTLKATVGAINAVGETYIVDGVMWGLRLLSESVPFVEAADATGGDATLERYILLMTDGDNSRSAELPDSAYHGGSDVAQANDWSIEACRQAKAADIEVFAITFGKDVSAEGRTIMNGCASSGKYYNSENVSDLNATFKTVAARIASIRLTR